MRNTVGLFSFTASEFETNPSFSVMIAYEDFESGKHAKRTYDVLAENVGTNYKCSNQMWKIDVLTVPVLREMAARDAAGADMVIISVRGTRDLFPELKDWLRLWLVTPGRTKSLVALVDSRERQSESWPGICAFLSEAARQAGVEFFAQPGDTASSSPENFILSRNPASLGDNFFTRANLERYERNFPRWGINE